MNAVQRTFIWLAGHQPKLLERDSPDDQASVAKLGPAVLLAALVAALSWGTAAFSLSDGAPTWALATATLAAALAGLAVTLAIDRAFVYFSDARRYIGLAAAAFLVGRLIIVFVSSTLVAHALMPLLLKNELQAVALAMAETAEQSRRLRLATQMDLPEKTAAQTQAVSAVQRAEAHLGQIPAEVLRLEADWRRCRSEFTLGLRNPPLDEDQQEAWRQRLAAQQAECNRLGRSAQASRAAHTEQARAAVAAAEANNSRAVQDVRNTQLEVTRRVDAARDLETRAFTPTSATVLAHLLANDSAAFTKWLLLTSLLLILETMPLWLKYMAGRSGVGERMLADADLRRLQRMARSRQAELDFEVSEQLQMAAREATVQALHSPATQAQFRQAFERHLVALAPIEAVSALMVELERRQEAVDDFTRHNPRLATLVADAWASAIQSSVNAARSATMPGAMPAAV